MGGDALLSEPICPNRQRATHQVQFFLLGFQQRLDTRLTRSEYPVKTYEFAPRATDSVRVSRRRGSPVGTGPDPL